MLYCRHRRERVGEHIDFRAGDGGALSLALDFEALAGTHQGRVASVGERDDLDDVGNHTVVEHLRRLVDMLAFWVELAADAYGEIVFGRIAGHLQCVFAYEGYGDGDIWEKYEIAGGDDREVDGIDLSLFRFVTYLEPTERKYLAVVVHAIKTG